MALLNDEVAAQGTQALFLNNLHVRKILEVHEFQDEDWEEAKKNNKLLKDIGLLITDPNKIKQRGVYYRKPEDDLIKLLNEDGSKLGLWDVDYVVAVVCINNHWVAKIIHITYDNDEKCHLIDIHTLQAGDHRDEREAIDIFDECIGRITDNIHAFKPENEHRLSIFHNYGIPAQLNDGLNRKMIPRTTDENSCGVYAIRNLAIAFGLLPEEWHEDRIEMMRFGLFDSIGSLAGFRSGAGSWFKARGQTGMRSISFRQPWPDLILTGQKLVENRNWQLYKTYKGEWVAIHASQKPDEQYCDPDKLDLYKQRSGCILGMCLSKFGVAAIASFCW